MNARKIALIIVALLNLNMLPTNSSTDPPKEIFLRHTITPLAICDDNRPVDPHKKVEECHTACNVEPTSKGRAKVSIMKDNSGAKKYNAVMCEKWKLTQTFTQTWTFSMIRGGLVKERVTLTSSECADTMGEKCQNYVCDYHLPESLPEEYYYASTNTVTKEFIVLITVPAVMMHYDGDFYLQVAHEKESFRANASPWSTEYRVYLWDGRETNECPFDIGMVLGCDKWQTGESMNYVCGGGRLAFEASGSKNLAKYCPIGTRISPEGIIYKEEKGEPATNYNAQRISMVSDNKLAGDSETLRVLTSNSLVHLDADLCSVSCEVAGLELRVARRQSTIIRTGSGYVLLSPKGHGYDCSKATQCSMVKPYKFCGDPPRIHVKCDGKYYFWNPTQSFILLDNGCHAPSSADRMYIHLGTHKYALDEDLTLDVPVNETDTVRTASYAITKGSLINYEDIPEIRAGWIQSKSTQRASIEINEERIIDQHSVFDSTILAPLSSIGKWIGKIINNVERGFIAILIIIVCIYISKPVISYIWSGLKVSGNVRNRRGGQTLSNQYEVEMI